jgi:hypothetical protein
LSHQSKPLKLNRLDFTGAARSLPFDDAERFKIDELAPVERKAGTLTHACSSGSFPPAALRFMLERFELPLSN